MSLFMLASFLFLLLLALIVYVCSIVNICDLIEIFDFIYSFESNLLCLPTGIRLICLSCVCTFSVSNYKIYFMHLNCHIDKQTSSSQAPRRNRKRDLLKRVMSSSSSHHRSHTNDASDAEHNLDSPVRHAKSIASIF